jgi:hypothetical protein
MTYEEARQLGDSYRDHVLARTGIPRAELRCLREKSEMTPCLVRDGGVVITFDGHGEPICVGCEARLTDVIIAQLVRRV